MNTGASITATCPACHVEVVLRPSALHMTLYDNGYDGFYSFFCPKCTELNDKPMDFGIVRILKDAGVRYTLVHIPLEITERGISPAPEISSDDIMDFHLDSAKTNYLADLAL